jgi:hypothetical protein
MKNWKLLGDAPKRNPHDQNYLMYQNIKTKYIIYIKEKENHDYKNKQNRLKKY